MTVAFKAVQFIDKELMPQPEGICFSPEGKLYISSEGKKGEPGNLFEFDFTGAVNLFDFKWSSIFIPYNT